MGAVDVILATRNVGKKKRIAALFRGSSIKLLSLDEANIEGEAIEDGNTLEKNALKKAIYVHDHMTEPLWVMAEDTGLFINALGGAPGIFASRWAGAQATTVEIMNHTLEKMSGMHNRTAMFETCVVLISPKGGEHFFSGKMYGRILESSRCVPKEGMPYGGIFVPEGFGLALAQMTVDMENRISHRAKAFRQARSFLEGLPK